MEEVNLSDTVLVQDTDDGGVALATGYSRLSMRNNLDVKINSKLSFAMGFGH